MPRKARIDASGALHHIISRGIERGKIFQDNADRINFLDRLSAITKETETPCYAWSLIANHFHLLLKTGLVPIVTIMRRLLTGYAVSYNRRHRRVGHLFQNRYKSILCQEETYLLELVRYIHLNPIRAKLVKDMNGLDEYPYSGHSVIMGRIQNDFQDIEWVLKLFGKRVEIARRKYRDFVQKGISLGRRDDLIGGGLIRSNGGWAAVKAMRNAEVFQKSDERILGSGDFVERVLSAAQEKMERKYLLRSMGYDLDNVSEKVADLMKLELFEIWSSGKERRKVQARSLLCYWAVKELGVSLAELSGKLKLSLSGVSLSVIRGEKIARDKGFELFGQKL